LNGKRILVGSVAFLRARAIAVPTEALTHADEGKAIVLVASDAIVLGYLAITESTKQELSRVVATLQTLGKQVVLLSGEHEQTARANALAVGIADVRADVASNKKDDVYQALRAEGRTVVAVSTQSRASAAVSIIPFTKRLSMSAITGADVLVRSDDLSTLEHLCSAVHEALVVQRAVPSRVFVLGATSGALVGAGVALSFVAPALIVVSALALPVAYSGSRAALVLARA
jgi:Cu+-exporting ATPase